jgi:hypothetical protein
LSAEYPVYTPATYLGVELHSALLVGWRDRQFTSVLIRREALARKSWLFWCKALDKKTQSGAACTASNQWLSLGMDSAPLFDN